MAKPTAKQLNVIVGQATWNTTFMGTIPSANNISVTSLFSGNTPGGTDAVVGIYTTAPQNKIYLRNRATQKAFQDSSQRQIIGRLVESSGVWAINFYTVQAGAEVAYSFAGSPDIGQNFDFRWCESVQLKDAKATNVVNFGEGIDEIDVSSPLIHEHQVDYFTATGGQTAFAFSATPKDYTDVAFFVNGIRYKYTTDFTAAGANATWLNTDFALEAGDIVTLEYAK
jgi:hypothetical protein